MSDKITTDKSAVELDETALDEASGGIIAIAPVASTQKVSPIENKFATAPISDGTSNIVVKH